MTEGTTPSTGYISTKSSQVAIIMAKTQDMGRGNVAFFIPGGGSLSSPIFDGFEYNILGERRPYVASTSSAFTAAGGTVKITAPVSAPAPVVPPAVPADGSSPANPGARPDTLGAGTGGGGDPNTNLAGGVSALPDVGLLIKPDGDPNALHHMGIHVDSGVPNTVDADSTSTGTGGGKTSGAAAVDSGNGVLAAVIAAVAAALVLTFLKLKG